MPNSLLLRIGWFHGPVIRGAAARHRAIQAEEQSALFREARLRTIITCYGLWGGFWLQFIISWIYDLPALHTISGGNWYGPSVYYFLPSPGPLPWSIAVNMVVVSASGALLALVGGWISTRGIPGKWRMRFAILGFSGLLLGYALAALPAEDASYDALRVRHAATRQEWLMESNHWRSVHLKERLDRMEAILEAHHP